MRDAQMQTRKAHGVLLHGKQLQTNLPLWARALNYQKSPRKGAVPHYRAMGYQQ
jgi:hypothetical protein